MNKIIIIAGPTGVGKTASSIALAKALNGEIISADSMQIYKGMDIGTAKITEEEKAGVVHHLLDVVEPKDEFSVSDFDKMATEAINDIIKRDKTPIVVGGTGLYINSLIYKMDYNNVSSDETLRAELWDFYEKNGEDALYDMLLELDSEPNVEKQNIKRVIRAIEILKNGGKKDAFIAIPKRDEWLPELIVLHRDRENLYEIINKRVDLMMEQGLLYEVNKFLEMGLTKNNQSMKAIGYRQILSYLEGEMDLEPAIDLIKRDSRRYAKRQLTWFRRYENAKWINVDSLDLESIINQILVDKK